MILIHKLSPLAVVEIKSKRLVLEESLIQVFEYMEALKIPVGFLANGFEIYQLSGFNLDYKKIQSFPSPENLWRDIFPNIGKSDPLAIEPAPLKQKTPQYFQLEAINSILEALKAGQKRVLVEMAVGTGKTYVLLQVLWKLIRTGKVSRTLYLDNSLLILDQIKHNLKHLDIEVEHLNSKSQPNSLFQTPLHLATSHHFLEPKGHSRIKNYPRDFYDLIVLNDVVRFPKIDEIMNHFDAAKVIGFSLPGISTTKSYQQLGHPVFSYTLEDCFL